MIKVDFAENAVIVSLADKEFSLQYNELHELSEIYMKFYIGESIKAYLKICNREDLSDSIEAVAENIYKDTKYMYNDNETIKEAIFNEAGEYA